MSLIVNIKLLPFSGMQFRGEEPPTILGIEPSDELQFEGPISYDLHVERVVDELLVRGAVQARIRVACSRCGRLYVTEVRDTEFDRSYDLTDEGDVPWAADQADSVDLTPEIREASILLLPPFPVCRTDCRGLCPTCGADLNEGECGCRTDRADRWNVLDKLTKA
jgi:uncharacterized protein